MSDLTRESELLRTFAKLADTLVADYDVVDLLQLLVDSCHDLLNSTAAGILLADSSGQLEVLASTSEAARLVEIMQLSAEAGPCIESFRTGRVVSVPNITDSRGDWSQFRDSALEQGFASIDSIPLRLRDTTIGALNLLRASPGEMDASDLVAAQAFADVATIGILHERSLRQSTLVKDQLQAALNSRIVVEQAKGVIAHLHGVSVDDAFTLIRDYARKNRAGIGHVAQQIVDRAISL